MICVGNLFHNWHCYYYHCITFLNIYGIPRDEHVVTILTDANLDDICFFLKLYKQLFNEHYCTYIFLHLYEYFWRMIPQNRILIDTANCPPYPFSIIYSNKWNIAVPVQKWIFSVSWIFANKWCLIISIFLITSKACLLPIYIFFFYELPVCILYEH